MNAVWTAEKIWENMNKSSRWVQRGVIALYHRQTDQEKIHNTSYVKNGIGFRKADAKFMTTAAKVFLQGRYLRYTDWLELKRRIKKYCGQLARIANENESVFLT